VHISYTLLRFGGKNARLGPVLFRDVLKDNDRCLRRGVRDVNHSICDHARKLLLLRHSPAAPHLYSNYRHLSTSLVYARLMKLDSASNLVGRVESCQTNDNRRMYIDSITTASLG